MREALTAAWLLPLLGVGYALATVADANTRLYRWTLRRLDREGM